MDVPEILLQGEAVRWRNEGGNAVSAFEGRKLGISKGRKIVKKEMASHL